MSTTLTNGIIIPDNGSRNWGGDLANNWNILDVHVGYMTDVKNRVTTLENSVAENTANIQTNASNISALQTSKQDKIEDLETIRTGASLGATAVQSSALSDYWSKSATGDQYSHSTFSYLSTIDKATTNTSWSAHKPFRIVDKDNSIELSYVECGYKSDVAYARLLAHHNNGGISDLTINSNGVSYFDNCSELWLINKNLSSYNTPPSNEIDTQIWFMDTNANKYATLQTDFYANGIRQFALTHKSLKSNKWIGLNIITSTTDDVILCQPRFQAQGDLIVQNTDPNMFTYIHEGRIEMSASNHCCIDFKHETSQNFVGRIGINPDNSLYLETINGAPITANGKNIVRSVNGVNADSNGNVNIQINASNISALKTSKQYAIEDLETIRAGATAGATAVQPSALSDYVDLSSEQIISGTKTFTTTPIVAAPTDATSGDGSQQVATTAWVVQLLKDRGLI